MYERSYRKEQHSRCNPKQSILQWIHSVNIYYQLPQVSNAQKSNKYSTCDESIRMKIIEAMNNKYVQQVERKE